MENTTPEAELAADLIGDYLFTDPDFVRKLSTEHRNIFEKIFDEIKYLCKVATAGTKEARQLEKVKKLFEEAYRKDVKGQENTTDKGGMQYSLSRKDGKNSRTKLPLQTSAKDDTITSDKTAYAGSEGNGNQDTELLAGGEVSTPGGGGNSLRQQGGNSAKLAGYLGLLEEHEGEAPPRCRAGESGRLLQKIDTQSDQTGYDVGLLRRISRIAPSGKDTIGRTISTEITEKFKNTVFKDENGNLLSLYHWTTEVFDKFMKGEFGFHLGTLIAAHDRYLTTKDVRADTQTGIYKEVYCNIRNPIEMSDDAGEWNASWVAQQLLDKGIITEHQYGLLSMTIGFYENTYDNPAAETVREILRKNGYDGIIYRNLSEDKGSFSVIALSPDQILTVAENGVLKENSGVSEAGSEEPAFSMSAGDERPVKNGSYNINSKDVAVESAPTADIAPVREDIAPVQNSLSRKGETQKQVGDYHVYGSDFGYRDPLAELGFPIREDLISKTEAGVKKETAAQNKTATQTAGEQDEQALGVDRDDFISQKATELYQEIAQLKKGVRASGWLGYLLDHGYEWRSIKTALLNIRDNPGQTVNPNSAAEAVAREMLGREYDEMIKDLNESTDVKSKIRIKIRNTQTELDKNRQFRDEALRDYDEEIAKAQAELDAKKNKDTKAAQVLKRRVERLNRLRADIDADYSKRISDLEKRLEKLHSKEYQRAEHRREKQAGYTKMWEDMIGDTSTWKDMAWGLSYKTKTLRRILRKVVRGADGNPDVNLADKIYDELETKYDHNEALLKRESQRLKEVFKDLKLNHTEDTYAHMLGELRHNPDTTLTEDVVKAYYDQHKGKIDSKKVDTAIDEARKTFDDLLVRVNEVLKEQGFKEIPYRQGYFPHFTNPKQGRLAKLLNWKTIDTEIPTSIAGLTEAFKPQRSWQSFDKQRMGDKTDYSLYQGLDAYIHGALDWIYHIEDLQKRRALENHLRYVHSDEGVKARIEEIKANDTYDADEAQEMINAVLTEANNPLGGLVRELMNRTNTLANKKSAMDRGMEDNTNRKIYSTMTNLNNRINANMVVGSLSSALTNFIPMVQSWHQVSPWFTVRGLGDYVRSVVKDDGMVAKSDFLTNRLVEEEKLYQTGWDKVSDKAAFMMNVIDSITSQTVWRSKYLQNIKEGMSESQAIKDADQFAKNLMAGRSRGNAPTIFDAKNPIAKIFTAFQLEVANQYGYMFEDVPQDTKSKARLVKGYATAFLGAYVYNALYSSLVGRDAAFDPIGILEDLLRDLGIFGDDEEEEPEDIILNLGENIVQEIPFIGGLVGGGRVPISSALPYSSDSAPFESMLKDVTEGNWDSFGKELMKPLYYLAMPVGGGQIKKTVEGLSMFSDEFPLAGSYTDSGSLRFPVEDTAGNWLQATLFGQWASENARNYFDNGRKPLEEKQIQEFKDLDIPIEDYWEYRENLSQLDSLEEKLGYISTLDLPIAKKNILANNLTDRKEPIDMAEYGDKSGLADFNYSQTNANLHSILQEHGISDEEYEAFDDDTKDAYKWAAKNPEKYTVSKAISGDLVVYRQYTSDLSSIKADKDANGKAVSGSRKEKVIDYINGLDADYGEKIILYKSEYPSDDRYNRDIIDYLNSRDDISYAEMETILTELGFEVLADGTVRWG